jgi:hypothetical protein
MRSSALPALPSARPAAALLLLGVVVVVELVAISLLYQQGFDFTCRDAAPAWFCAFAGRIVPRVLGILAALVLFVIARRAALATLLAQPGSRGTGLALNLAGFVLILLPWFGLSDASGSAAVTAAALSWSLGGVLATVGVALYIAPLPAWTTLFRDHGVVLAVLLAVGLGLPELSDQLQPLWRIEAVTEVTFAATLWLLGFFGYVVQAVPAQKLIGTEDFYVAVGPQCSGVEGFVLITVFLALYIGLFRRELRFPQVLLLFPLGLALSWAFNVLRISVLLMIGLEGHGELAIGAFHSHAGWLTFTMLSLLLILASRAVPWFMRRDGSVTTATLPPFFRDPAVMRILPFIVFMASALLASTLSQSPGELYLWRALAMAAGLALVWEGLRALPWRIDALSVGAGVAIAALWIMTGPATADAPYGTLTGTAFAIWLVARIIGTTLLVPVIEELFFRDYLISRIAPSGRGVAMIVAVAVSTAAFAALHDRWIVAALAGLVFAALVWRSRNVTDAILAHATANGLIAVFALVTGAWQIL